MGSKLICPICGKVGFMHGAVCPKYGCIVCDQCHTVCEWLDKRVSLWRCRYSQKGGVVHE